LGCLNSIIRQSENSQPEIIVIDNNSVDDSVKLVKQFGYPINLILNDNNIGFARACNQGIQLAKGNYIFLLNPDTELLNDALNIFFDFMEKKGNELVWCVGAQIFNEYRNPSKSYGHFPTLFDVFFEQFGIKGILLKCFRTKNLIQNKIINQILEVPYVMGCDMFIKKRVLDKIGLFNEKFFLNFEETELSLRAKKAGYVSIILPNVKILHYSGKSFLDLKDYLSHLWLGQLLFFRVTKNSIKFYIVKILHIIGTLLRLFIKLDPYYLYHLRKIYSI
jgi:GT2 family glycosyltransferase